MKSYVLDWNLWHLRDRSLKTWLESQRTQSVKPKLYMNESRCLNISLTLDCRPGQFLSYCLLLQRLDINNFVFQKKKKKEILKEAMFPPFLISFFSRKCVTSMSRSRSLIVSVSAWHTTFHFSMHLSKIHIQIQTALCSF